MNEREAFEAWISEWMPETFEEQRTHYLGIWQAACKWQRERDAEIADRARKLSAEESDFNNGWCSASLQISQAILNQGSQE